MNNKNLICSLLGTFFLISLSNYVIAESRLRQSLENVLKEYVATAKAGDLNKISKAMSSYRLATMKNNMASAGKELSPAILKSMVRYMPDVTKAEFVKVIEKGPTAGLVYRQNRGDKINFVVIKFVREAKDWKVDSLTIQSPKKGQEEFDQTALAGRMKIDGKVMATPKLLKKAEVAGRLNTNSYGYKIEVEVNGIQQQTPIKGSGSRLILGGLRKGENSVTIRIAQIEKKSSSLPEISIATIQKNRTLNHVFTFEPKDKKSALGEHKFTFNVKK